MRDVVVDGRVVVENGKLLTLDEAAILAEVAALAPALSAGMADLRREAAELEPYYRELYLRAMARDVGLDRRGRDG